MNHSKWILLVCVVVLAIGFMMSTGCAEQEEVQEGEAKSSTQEEKAKVELPAAVVKTIEDNVPNAEIAKVEVEEKGGIKLYDIEFKTDQGEIEVAADGTIIEPLKWDTKE